MAKKKKEPETKWEDPLDCRIPNVCYSICRDKYYYRHLSRKNKEKYRQQRLERGFDDTEVWEMYVAVAKFMIPRLRVFKESVIGHPMDLSKYGDRAMEKWKKIIGEIIWMLEDAVTDDESMKLYHKYFDENKLRPGMSEDDWLKELDRLGARLKRAQKYLGKYFMDFWD